MATPEQPTIDCKGEPGPDERMTATFRAFTGVKV